MAKKAVDAARKPENQARAKSALASARTKATSRRTGGEAPGGPAGGEATTRRFGRSSDPRR